MKPAAGPERRATISKRPAQPGGFQRILLPMDFSVESTRALQFAAALARHHKSHLTLVHVVGPVYDLRDFGYARQRLDTLARKHAAATLQWQPGVRSGDASQQILEEAGEMEADLIVLSTRGLSHGPPSKIGNIAKRIVRHSPCPVLVLPGGKDTARKRAGRKLQRNLR